MGYSMREIAQILQIDKSAVNRDIHFIRQQAQENIKNHIQERMPQEYHMVEVSINHVLKNAWHIANTTADERIKLQALSLVKECNSHKLEMITNGTVVSDALKYVNGKAEKLKLESESESNESEEPDYGEEEELEEKQEKDTGELEDKEEETTTNDVF
jgi:uncharacterized membrane protein YukC